MHYLCPPVDGIWFIHFGVDRSRVVPHLLCLTIAVCSQSFGKLIWGQISELVDPQTEGVKAQGMLGVVPLDVLQVVQEDGFPNFHL